jgi:Trk K+ transport system NAD-binding subunit
MENKVVKHATIFCDIDGTLFKYREFSDLQTVKAEVIPSVADYLRLHEKLGSHIVITTARPENLRHWTVHELNKNEIPYHQLVMGIGRGNRILINDHKEGHSPRAISFPIVRNEGLPEIKNEEIFNL